MTGARQGLGRRGEQLAAQWLAERGYAMVAANWRYPGLGEIDLVARDGPCLVIVEVRTRRGRAFGTPEESLTNRKQARLADLAQVYVEQQAWQGPVRIDVVGVHLSASGRLLEVNHIVDAIGR